MRVDFEEYKETLKGMTATGAFFEMERVSKLEASGKATFKQALYLKKFCLDHIESIKTPEEKAVENADDIMYAKRVIQKNKRFKKANVGSKVAELFNANKSVLMAVANDRMSVGRAVTELLKAVS